MADLGCIFQGFVVTPVAHTFGMRYTNLRGLRPKFSVILHYLAML